MQLALINADGSRCGCYTKKNSKDILTMMLPDRMTPTHVFPQILTPRIITQLHFLTSTESFQSQRYIWKEVCCKPQIQRTIPMNLKETDQKEKADLNPE